MTGHYLIGLTTGRILSGKSGFFAGMLVHGTGEWPA